MVLVGNKVDLSDKRVISKEQGMQLAKLHGCSFFETSALTGEGVPATFTTLAQEIIGEAEPQDAPKADANPERTDRTKSFYLRRSPDEEDKKSKKGGCCG